MTVLAELFLQGMFVLVPEEEHFLPTVFSSLFSGILGPTSCENLFASSSGFSIPFLLMPLEHALLQAENQQCGLNHL